MTVRKAAPSLERHAGTGVERFSGAWQGHRTRHHAHPEYQLTLGCAGTGRFEYLGGTALIPAGCMAFFHPGEPHVLASAERDRPWSLRSFHIPSRWLEADGRPLLQPVPLLADAALQTAFDGVWEAFAQGGMAEALGLLARTLRRRPGLEPVVRSGTGLVRRCLDHLAEHLDRPVPCGELARVAHSTPVRVRRAVVAATGLPPGAWHLQRRIDEAKHRLRAGTGIVAVALATGFSDQAHFTRHFTRLVGVSPGRYASGAAPGA